MEKHVQLIGVYHVIIVLDYFAQLHQRTVLVLIHYQLVSVIVPYLNFGMVLIVVIKQQKIILILLNFNINKYLFHFN